MNRIFWEYLQKYTDHPFELIVIDNGSTDGSREFFQSLGEPVRVICNSENYSYPHSQNQGVALARYDVLAFLNNDLLVSPHWDSRMLEVLGKEGRDAVSLGSNDRLADGPTSKRLQRRWKRIKYPLVALFGQRGFALRWMARLCYGNWERYTEKIFRKYGYSLTEGFSGSAIILNRRGIEKLGAWDPTQQAADFNLFYETCRREEVEGDLRKLAVINGVFVHHYRRLSFKQAYPPFADADNLSTLQQKWRADDLARWSRIIDFRQG